MKSEAVLSSFPPGGTAVVIGASGAIGTALLTLLQQEPGFAQVIAFSRSLTPALNLSSEASIAAAAMTVRDTSLRLVIDATGFLHQGRFQPERSWRDLTPEHLTAAFAINAIGPALLMKHFLPILPRAGKSVFASLSAKVGSIGDNRLGGWYSYRASKAALNQLIHTAAIELRRTRPEALCIALHPGTVDTPLSQPFAKSGLVVQPPAEAAARLLAVIDALDTSQTGGFFDYRGRELPW